jgi:hypothetical protein
MRSHCHAATPGANSSGRIPSRSTTNVLRRYRVAMTPGRSSSAPSEVGKAEMKQRTMSATKTSVTRAYASEMGSGSRQ